MPVNKLHLINFQTNGGWLLMVTQNKKILIITGSFGNGHMQVTQSIVNQLNDMNLDHLRIIEHDLFIWKPIQF